MPDTSNKHANWSLRKQELTVLDLFWLLILWVLIGLLVAIAIGRALDLGRGSDNEDEATTQQTADRGPKMPRRHSTNEKRSADSWNKNVKDAEKEEIEEKQGKRAA